MDIDIKDPLFSKQWNLAMMNVPAAWQYTMGEGAVVGIIDSGVDFTHKDLGCDRDIEITAMDSLAAIKQKTQTVFENISRCNNPRILPGWNFIRDNDFIWDELGHGTYMAGLIAADMDDIGIVGVAPRCKIRPYVVLGADGRGSSSLIAKAIRDAVDAKCDVISMSLQYNGMTPGLDAAVAYALENHVILIAAAGNQDEEGVADPAACDGVLAIGACNIHGGRWVHSPGRGSNYGPGLFCICPGDAQLTTHKMRSRWSEVDATSAACANMSGIAALAKSIDPFITSEEFASLVRDVFFGVDDRKFWKSWDKWVGYDVPDAEAIVSALPIDSKPDEPVETNQAFEMLKDHNIKMAAMIQEAESLIGVVPDA